MSLGDEPHFLTRTTQNEIIPGRATPSEKISSGELKVLGDRHKLGELPALMDDFDFWFNVSTPGLVGVQAAVLFASPASGQVSFGSRVDLAPVSAAPAASTRMLDPLREPPVADSGR